MNTDIEGISKRFNFLECTTTELLLTHAAVIEELRSRKILRTKNNPIADYTEWLVSNALGLTLQGNSSSGFDALDSEGYRVQIKGRRVTSTNKSVQLSSIRNLLNKPFDYLIGVIYKENFTIDYVARIPHEVIAEHAKYRQHTNSHIMHLRRTIFFDSRVDNITEKFLANEKLS